jgi:hypothetical protein
MDKVPCRTPTPRKSGVTNVPKWKFDVCRAAILSALHQGPIQGQQMAERAGREMTAHDVDALGSLGWHITTVRLEMEVRGEIERVPGKRPLELKLGAQG